MIFATKYIVILIIYPTNNIVKIPLLLIILGKLSFLKIHQTPDMSVITGVKIQLGIRNFLNNALAKSLPYEIFFLKIA